MSDDARIQGPDLRLGVPSQDLKEGQMISGRFGEEKVLIARVEGQVHAIGAECTHYHAPLEEGLIQDCAVRCPWHHARFSLKTGEAIAAPAFDAVPTYEVREAGGRITVVSKRAAAPPTEADRTPALGGKEAPGAVVIVGGGAGGFAAAEMLRRRGYSAAITLLSAETDAPYDRPNCSKDFLAGEAPSEWMPLKDQLYYKENGIDLRLNAEAAAIDLPHRRVELKSGERISYDILILAMGAEPRRPDFPGADANGVFLLRSLADARALSNAAETASAAVVIGSSFIGLEAAAALRKRGLEVHVVSPEKIPLAARLGEEVGRWAQGVHEKEGVVFHLGASVLRYEAGAVHLRDGETLKADLVVLGVGVKPRVAIAETAGLVVDDGVVVDDRLRARPNVYAVGDICRYPEPISGHLARIEHWVHAERQGQHVARLILGEDAPFREAPFFWSAHYASAFHYQGHMQTLDQIVVDGSMTAADAAVSYLTDGRRLAVLTINRDLQSLEAEAALEKALT